MGRLASFLAPQVDELQSFAELQFQVEDPSSSTGHPELQDRFTVAVPCCLRQVKWHVLYDARDPSQAPDVIFSEWDEGFAPILPQANAPGAGSSTGTGARSSNWTLLEDWQPGDRTRLLKLILNLRQLYLQHNWAIAETVEDPKVAFELSTLARTPGTEVFAVLSGSWGERKVEEVHVSVPLQHVNLSALAPFSAFAAIAGVNSTQGIQQPRLMLQVIFDVRSGSQSGSTGTAAAPVAPQLPQVSLSQPPVLDELLSLVGFKLPPWTDSMCMVEYEPLVREQLQAKIFESAQGLEVRSSFLLSLTEVFGTPLELDSVTFLRASFNLHSEAFYFTLFVLMTPKFPMSQPALYMQSIQNFDVQGRPLISQVFDAYPWSPRWPSQEMSKRIMAFLVDEVLRFKHSCGQ